MKPSSIFPYLHNNKKTCFKLHPYLCVLILQFCCMGCSLIQRREFSVVSAFTLFCPYAGPKDVGNFALFWLGFMVFFQYSCTLGRVGNTALPMNATVWPGASGTEPKLTTALSSSRSSLAAFVRWICLQNILSF